MKWLEVHIDTNYSGLEGVETMLSTLGIDGVVIDDETEFQDFLENNHEYWDYVDEELAQRMQGRSRLTFYLEVGEEGFAKMGEVRMALEELKKEHDDWGTLLMTMDTMEDADWENNWKQYYKPMEIGERLLVIPQWETAEVGDRVPLILEPGLTFGTGSHATTRLCLMALEKHVKPGMRVVDLGCGSGILSIAALKLGAAEARAIDIDDKCINVAYENAAMNGIGKDSYTVLSGNILTDQSAVEQLGGGYDIVVANIVSDIIIALAPQARYYMKEDALFLCSGIIDTRAEEVKGKLVEAGFEVLEERSADGWFSFLCK